MKAKVIIGFISLLLAISIAWAENPTNSPAPANELAEAANNTPTGCSNEGYSFQNGQLILGGQNSLFKPNIYLIHNHSDYQQLLLSHPTQTAMSAGWDSRLDRGQWSALIINQTNFVLNCFGRKPGAIGYVNCQSVVEVCSYPKAQLGSESSYWLAENKSLRDLIDILKVKNITPSK